MTIVTHITILDQSQDNVLGLRLQGRLTDQDLLTLAAELQEVNDLHGHLRLLLELKSIKNYSPSELWEAISLHTPPLRDVERLALVCDSEDYKRWLDTLSGALIGGEVQYFEPSQLRAAWEWIKE